MKKLLIVALCLTLAFTLVACAMEDKDKNNTDLPTNDQPNTAPNANNGTAGGNGGTVVPGSDTYDEGNNNAATPGQPDSGSASGGAQSKARRSVIADPYDAGINSSTTYDYGNNYGYYADGMATWEQMLDNGRVRDTDGFLLDGENSSWT